MAALADHIRYLERRLDGCVPETLHREQIGAYRNAIAAAQEADSESAYLDATGALIELTRAEWIDRYENAARLYDGLGDSVRASIARDSAAAAAGAADVAALIGAVTAAKRASTARRQGAEDASAQLPVLVQTLIGLRLDRSPEARRERRDELGALWREMSSGDPELLPGRLLSHPPYRARLPFDDAGVGAVVAWLEELDLEPGALSEPPEVPEPPAVELPSRGPVPTADAIAAPYRAAAATLPDDPGLEALRRAYRRIDELAAGAADGNALLAAMAEADLFVTLAREPLLADARSTREAIGPAQRALRAHYDRQIEALAAARSVAELELIALAGDEHLAVESAWSHLLFSVALMPIAAALAYDIDRSSGRREYLRDCEAVVVELLGAGTAALLEIDPLWRLFVREVFDHGQSVSLEEAEDRPVRRGETALPIAGHVQAATVQWAIVEASRTDDPATALRQRLADRRFASPEAMRDHVLEVLESVGIGPSGALRPLKMWGQKIEPDDVGAALLDPRRPPIAL